MKFNLKEAGEKTAFVKTAGGQTKTIEYKDEKELTTMKDNPDIKTVDTAGGKKIKENIVKDSLGEELAIGDTLEVQGKRFMVKESETGVCLATMEGKCVMDVTDPRARTLFENSKRVMDESYEPTSPEEPVLSVGHVDDEPGMLKQTAYDIVKYGADLYKMLMYYESMNTHVDLPHWIQAKIVLARDYISKATHYLEYEGNETKIHRMIGKDLEENNPEQAPTKPDTETIPRETPSQPDRRRRITPGPQPGVRPRPKALFEDDEILNKIVTRFNKEKK